MHIFGKSAYDWSVTDDGEQLHVVSRGAGEQAEEALGIASTHSPSGGPMAGRSGGEREDDRKPWDTKGRARDADLPRPPAVQGGGAQPPVPGALGRFYDAYYARHP
jgi:hypothetical protein